MRLTSHTCKELTCKALDLRTGKWHKAVAFEKIEDTLTQKISDNTDMVSKVEGVSQVDALVSVCFVVESKCGKDAQFDAASIAIFLNRSDDFDSTFRSLFLIECLNNLSKGTLTEELDDIV
jgi:hypothetical protein